MQSRFFSTLPVLTDLDTLEFLPVDSNARPIVTLGTRIAGEDIPNDVLKVEEQANYTVLLGASGLIKTGPGVLFGFAFATGGTVKVWDSTAASGTVLMATATVSGSGEFSFPAAVKFTTGCYFTVTSANITVVWR